MTDKEWLTQVEGRTAGILRAVSAARRDPAWTRARRAAALRAMGDAARAQHALAMIEDDLRAGSAG
jgi:hypothetical protein